MRDGTYAKYDIKVKGLMIGAAFLMQFHGPDI